MTVTLITGDRVTVTPGTGGTTTPTVDVTRAPGATGSVRISTQRGDTYVYPDEAMPYLATGRLDKQLFNVTQLIAQGFDDTRTAELPLIVTRAAGSAKLRAGSTLPGAQTTMELSSVDGEAIRTRRSEAAHFWSGLTGGAGSATSRSAATAAPSFTAGVDTVWLDGKAKATLADTTAQIGAPAAWAAGGTGKGVRVAVLDGGVDAEHPDFANQIVASRSFIPGQDASDHNGHGTHTASTVAGTGAASGGKERGVAPEADLVVGKVLDENGNGSISGIVAGMEWAARTEHAKVINMSLGVSAWHTQNDPLSQAVNKLTAETGALFVVAAGNNGNDPSTLGAPGTADAALTVGAVDAADHLAIFSSGGPRLNDEGLKPDLTAPGVNVLAARSQYDPFSTGYYVENSGTSMAAPHVAGAAALLVQKHPTWTPQQIKDALMSTSVRTPDYNAYQAGSGRLDVAAAYDRDQVIATGSVDAGLVKWAAGTTPQPIKRKITYTNTTAKPVTLEISVDRGAYPAQTFTAGANRVTVPARGTSTVDVVVDPKGLTQGQHSAQVKARSAAGEVHTAVGVSVEPRKYELSLRLKDRAGRPANGEVEILSADGGFQYMWTLNGELNARLVPGTYSLVTTVDVEGRNGPHSLGLAMLSAPEVELTADRVVTLDASKAREVKVATAQATTIANSRIDVHRSFTSTEPSPSDSTALLTRTFPSAAYDSLWALPTEKVKKGSFIFATRIRAKQTPLEISYDGRRLSEPLLQPGTPALPDGTTRLDAVFAGNGAKGDYAQLSARGKAVVVRSNDSVAPTDQAAAAHAAGAAMLLVVSAGNGRTNDWYGNPDVVTTGPIPVASLLSDEGERLIQKIAAAGRKSVRLAVEAHPAPRYLYDLLDQHRGRVPNDPSAKTDPRDLARIDLTFSPPAGQKAEEKRLDFPPYAYAAAPAFPAEPVSPGPRTDWVTASSDIKWQQRVDIELLLASYTEVMSYQPGSVQKDRWFGPVIRPRLLKNDSLVRGDVWMSATIGGYSDGGAAHGGGTAQPPQSVLYQGNKEIARSSGFFPWLDASGLAAETLPYRLVVDTSGLPELGPYSTATRTEWSFTSKAGPEIQAIPLVQLDYETEVDLAGQAKRHSEFSIIPVVTGSTAAQDAVSSVKMEVSYDDGATWQRQDVKEKKGAWRASLNAPNRADFVSIRVTATQRNGGSVTQTVTRAFGLK
ncbi:S8 family serine peptidase [Micromonospora violae]|uniref:S8 family serine peptidase n=1 Tax=Micromonospora violae TaxID=1278207 RepID=UPI003410EB8A